MDTRSIKTIPNAFSNVEIVLPFPGDKRVDDAGRKYTWVVKTEGTISIGTWEEEVVKYEIDWTADTGIFFTATPAVNTIYAAPQGPIGSTGPVGSTGVPAAKKKGI